MVTILEPPEAPPQAPTRVQRDVANKVSAAAWAIFFVWLGYAILAQIPLGVGLLGVGVITLGAQGVRKAFGLSLEGFWFLAGILLVMAGVWNLLSLEVPFLPYLLFAVALGVLAGAFLQRR